jgi:soluble lytic murein transglycosylase-like protein
MAIGPILLATARLSSGLAILCCGGNKRPAGSRYARVLRRFAGAPPYPETRQYVRRVLERFQRQQK